MDRVKLADWRGALSKHDRLGASKVPGLRLPVAEHSSGRTQAHVITVTQAGSSNSTRLYVGGLSCFPRFCPTGQPGRPGESPAYRFVKVSEHDIAAQHYAGQQQGSLNRNAWRVLGGKLVKSIQPAENRIMQHIDWIG